MQDGEGRPARGGGHGRRSGGDQPTVFTAVIRLPSVVSPDIDTPLGEVTDHSLACGNSVVGSGLGRGGGRCETGAEESYRSQEHRKTEPHEYLLGAERNYPHPTDHIQLRKELIQIKMFS